MWVEQLVPLLAAAHRAGAGGSTCAQGGSSPFERLLHDDVLASD